ncbi:Deiodinase, iodothyronine, type I [Desmophyllum pertusum]|uniref:Iodothyronine deiodinase n=1 Tax=Desmophyllum pertusum TaxID=174260 RepID=A0A9W9ZK70_9CNID|nr:Deiodinase, iodothyronine, type I [Desmophyllum pertusum]
MVRHFRQQVDFVVLYIEEVHPTDGWAFKNNYKIRQHQTIQQRCAAAKLLLPHCPVEVPIVVDTMWNAANAAYGATPERLYIIKDGIILYQGGMGPFGYDLAEVTCCLNKIIKGNN